MDIEELTEDITALSAELSSIDPDNITQRYDVERLLAFRRHCLRIKLDSLYGGRPESGRRLHGEG